MFIVTLLPVGILQVSWVIRHGFWIARSAEFYNQPLVQALGQVRMIPDLIMILGGVLVLIYLVTTAMFNLRPAEISDGEVFPE
jgi:nitric oxide reductase subunit B